MLGLSNRVALVTGAGGGIGAATSRVLAENGADVVVTDVVSETERVAAEIEETGAHAVSHEMDVTDATEVEAVVDATLDEFGRLDILANVAGIFPTHTRSRR